MVKCMFRKLQLWCDTNMVLTANMATVAHVCRDTYCAPLVLRLPTSLQPTRTSWLESLPAGAAALLVVGVDVDVREAAVEDASRRVHDPVTRGRRHSTRPTEAPLSPNKLCSPNADTQSRSWVLAIFYLLFPLSGY